MPSESYEALSRDGKILTDLLGTNLPSGAVSDWKGGVVQAVFSHFGRNLKQKLGDHRGMKVTRQAAFLSWYLTFTRVKTLKDLKKLWGWWKTEFSRI